MKAMILAAGRGTRMGALTKHAPKPLIQLAGMSLIEYHVRALAAGGFDDIVINVAWHGEQIVEALGDGRRFGVSIDYSQEPEGALETAGGIAHAMAHLGEAPFLVVNGDVWTDFPFHALRDVVDTDGPHKAHLVMVPNPPHHANGDFYYARASGSLAANAPDLTRHSAQNALDKDSTAQKYTFSGIGVYHPVLFNSVHGRASLGPLFREWIDKGLAGAQLYTGHWWDVGTPERLDAVEAFLRGSRL